MVYLCIVSRARHLFLDARKIYSKEKAVRAVRGCHSKIRGGAQRSEGDTKFGVVFFQYRWNADMDGYCENVVSG